MPLRPNRDVRDSLLPFTASFRGNNIFAIVMETRFDVQQRGRQHVDSIHLMREALRENFAGGGLPILGGRKRDVCKPKATERTVVRVVTGAGNSLELRQNRASNNRVALRKFALENVYVA